MAQVKITLVKSPIGSTQNVKACLKALGLTKMNQSVVRENTNAVWGNIHRVANLVKVEEM